MADQETPEIMQTETRVKVKNPNRVAAGKRLAEFNKKNTEKIKAEIAEARQQTNPINDEIVETKPKQKDITIQITERAPLIISVGALVLGLYLWSRPAEIQPSTTRDLPVEVQQPTIQAATTINEFDKM